MAMMPGATNRLLANQARQGLMKSYDAAVLHTMVGSLAGTDSMFQEGGTVGTESHFGIGEHGEIYQWVDTKYTADANYLGSGHVISIETADYGGSFGRWNTAGDNVPYWNAAQITAIVKILIWVHETHGIPLTATKSVTEKGVGYHAQGVPGNELPNSLRGTKYQWSKYAGKVCPGKKRISQIPEIVRLAQGGATSSGSSPTPKKEGILGMTKYSGGKIYRAVQNLVKNKWRSLYVGKGSMSILTCDGSPYLAQVYLTVTGLKPDETIQVRFITASYKSGTTTKNNGYYAKQEQHGSAGGTYISHTQIGKTGKGKNGRSNRLRVQVWTDSKTAKITSIQTKFMKG
ncbi:N-acetylmuramoyl-L-alanine amidase [Brevibacterium zhoupengii]|uniref:peptidoglycan recognition protein family protein n=1 Tax=Brevibacterium zhoupengii TaxID=2898795 RepID=UPI001F09AB83|nr:N-acetylmuramoyl-L-alanine amidase [Brevibacterium zhoupengii]